MSGEIDRKVLHAAMFRIEDCSSLALCALDTVVRIEDDEKKLFDCRYCVFKDEVKMLICPNEIKEDVLKLRLK